MAWEGFLIESKKFMNHPDYWNEWDIKADWYPNGWTLHDKRKAKLKFWWKFPKAFIKFHYYGFRDWYYKIFLYNHTTEADH